MIEITQQRAQQLFGMMEYLKASGNYNMFYESTFEGMCELFRLRDLKGKLIGEVELRFNKYYYKDS